MVNILVADDEPAIIELISLYIETKDMNIIRASDGEEALEIISKYEISLCILDIMMPKMNGFQVVEAIRKDYAMPVIILSAREDFSDKIHGLQIGADDYMTKPFNAMELKARVDAHLRRYLTMEGKSSNRLIKIGELEIDFDACAVYREDKEIDLTAKEFQIFALMAEKPGRVYTKKQIYEAVWDETYYDDENTIRIHLSNLRDKIELTPKNPVIIKTVRGLGYKVEKLVKHEVL